MTENNTKCFSPVIIPVPIDSSNCKCRKKQKFRKEHTYKIRDRRKSGGEGE